MDSICAKYISIGIIFQNDRVLKDMQFNSFIQSKLLISSENHFGFEI